MARTKSTARRTRQRRTQTAAALRGGRRRGAATQDALRLLKSDHEAVTALFERFERSRQDSVKQQLAERICADLTVHAQIEEEIFYPAVREGIGDDDLMDEATVEHASAKQLIAEIKAAGPGEELFDAKVTVLGEYVKHHVKEEQSEMFPKVRKAGIDLRDLGERLAARKRQLSGG